MATQTKLSGKVKVNDNLDYVDIEMHLTVKVPGKDTPQSCYEVALVPYYEDEKYVFALVVIVAGSNKCGAELTRSLCCCRRSIT